MENLEKEGKFTQSRSPFKDLSNSIIKTASPGKRKSVEEWKERIELITSHVHENHKKWAHEFIEEALTKAMVISKKDDTVSCFPTPEEPEYFFTPNSTKSELAVETLSNKPQKLPSDPVEVITLDDSSEELDDPEAFSRSLIDKMQNLKIATPKVGFAVKSYSVFKECMEEVGEIDVNCSIQWLDTPSELICVKDSDSEDDSENTYENSDVTIIQNDTISNTGIENFTNDTETSHSPNNSITDAKEDAFVTNSNIVDETMFLDASDSTGTSLEKEKYISDDSKYVYESTSKATVPELDFLDSFNKEQVSEVYEYTSVCEESIPNVNRHTPTEFSEQVCQDKGAMSVELNCAVEQFANKEVNPIFEAKEITHTLEGHEVVCEPISKVKSNIEYLHQAKPAPLVLVNKSFSEFGLVVEETMAAIEERASEVNEPLLVVEPMPAVENSVSEFSVVDAHMAVIEEPASELNEPLHVIEEPVSKLEEPVFQLNKPLPIIEEPIEPFPVIKEPNEPFPMIKESIEPVPVIKEPVSEIEESISVADETIRAVNETMHAIEEPASEVNEPLLVVEPMPEVEKHVSECSLVDEHMSVIEEPASELNEPLHVIEEPVFQLNEPLPIIEGPIEPFPVIKEPNEPFPVIKEPNEPFPVIKEPVSEIEESISVADETIHAVNETIPVVDDPINVIKGPVYEIISDFDERATETTNSITDIRSYFSNEQNNSSDVVIAESCNIQEETMEKTAINLYGEINERVMNTFETMSTSSDEFHQLEDFESAEKQIEMEDRLQAVSGQLDTKMEMRKSISSLEFDAIASEALSLLDMPTTPATCPVNDVFVKEPGAESQDDEFVDADEFFHNDQELDDLSKHGVAGDGHNLARNSLFLKFDPLVANRQSLAPFLAREDEELRRGSALINFSPVKKPEVKTALKNHFNQTILVKINDTINESSFFDDSINPSDVTVLARTLSNKCVASSDACTQTEFEVILKQESKDTIQLVELKYQDELLRKSRELDFIRREYEAALESSQYKLEETRNMLSMTLKINQHTKTMLGDIIEKKKLLEFELQQEITDLKEKNENEICALKKQLDLKQSEMAESDCSSLAIIKKCERMKGIIEGKARNEITLKTEIASVNEKMKEIKETARITFNKLETQICTEYEEHQEEKRSYESEIDKCTIMLKMAEMKILSLSESIEKKEKECNRMQIILNEVTHRFGK